MSFAFAPATPRRRPSLTPMIDVVFLLLVFFMLAARFGQDAEIALTAATAGDSPWQGPPRLVDIGPESLHLNGRIIDISALEQALNGRMETESDAILLRPIDGSQTQRLIDIMVILRAAGFTNLRLVSP